MRLIGHDIERAAHDAPGHERVKRPLARADRRVGCTVIALSLHSLHCELH
jgi:hypothetical protein